MPSRVSNSIMGKKISNNAIIKSILALFFITLLLFFLIRKNKSTENFNVEHFNVEKTKKVVTTNNAKAREKAKLRKTKDNTDTDKK